MPAVMPAFVTACMPAFPRKLAVLATAWLAFPAMAAAAAADGMATSAWRCGAEGRVYTDTPCAGGREIELPAARPAADIRDAERLAKREAALAERLKREREAREAAGIAASAQPVNLGPVRPVAASKRWERAERPTRPSRSDRSGRLGHLGSDGRRVELSGLASDRPAPERALPPKTKKAHRPAFDPDADERTWRAIAPASPRTPG